VSAVLFQTLVSLVLAAIGLGLLANLALVMAGSFPSALTRGELFFAAWLFGGLAFLNTWDSPIYLALLLAVLAWLARGEALGRVLARLATAAWPPSPPPCCCTFRGTPASPHKPAAFCPM
jgi:hypothetical protein